MKNACAKLVLTLCSALAVAPAAHAMNDPTRPPAALAESPVEGTRAAPTLQTIIIGPHVRAAIIDGERVELGGRYRDARVVRITESEVVLREGERTEILKMYPDVEKKFMKSVEPARGRTPATRSRQ